MIQAMDSFVLKPNFGVKYITRIHRYCKLPDCIITDYGGVRHSLRRMCKTLAEWSADWNPVVL